MMQYRSYGGEEPRRHEYHRRDRSEDRESSNTQRTYSRGRSRSRSRDRHGEDFTRRRSPRRKITDSDLSDKSERRTAYKHMGGWSDDEEDEEGKSMSNVDVDKYKKPVVPSDCRVRPGQQGGKSRVKATPQHNALMHSVRDAVAWGVSLLQEEDVDMLALGGSFNAVEIEFPEDLAMLVCFVMMCALWRML